MQDDERLQELRDILLREDSAYLTETVKSVLAEAAARRVEESKDQMAAALAPVLGQAIRHQLQDAQEDIIDALYPVIGRTIQRSVAEAMRALARRVDAGLRSTFNLKRLTRRIQARLTGVPESELLLREALPFQIQQVFLIHRSSGLLLAHLSKDPSQAKDSDIVSSMLTAIRDFAQDAFGADEEGGLDQIQYGEFSILLEPGPWAYLAVVLEGIEPEGYRHEMRSVLSDIDRTYTAALRDYDGDAARLAGVDEYLRPLLAVPQAPAVPEAPSRPPWVAIAAASTVLLLCVSLACLGAWRLTWGRPSPTATPTATFTATAAPTPSPTNTPTPTPTLTPSPEPTNTPTSTSTSTPTATLTPTPSPLPTSAPFVAVMIGSVWLRAEPRPGSPVTGDTVERGRAVEVLAIYRDWYLIRYPPGDPAGTQGWVPGQWVGLVGPPPMTIITPGP